MSDFTEFRRAVAALGTHGVVPGAAAYLDRTRDSALAGLREAIVGDIPAFSATANPDILPELQQHTADHVAELHRLLAGGAEGDFEFVRRHARRRADQKFPLEALLHAYRFGHKAMSQWMREAALAVVDGDAHDAVAAVADFAIEYTNAISTIATSEYVAQTRLVAEAESDQRSELLAILLQGYDESDGRVARLLKRAGYLAQRQSFCVTVAQSLEPREMENPARAQRMVEAIGDCVADLPVRKLIGVRDNVVTAVFSDTRRLSGWTSPQTLLAERIRPKLERIGPVAMIGVSADVPSTSHIPKALREARIALDFASVTSRVVLVSDIPVRQIVLRAARDTVPVALPSWVDDLLSADRLSKGKLLATLRAYADADMNVSHAAKLLGVHPNTVYTRMEKIAGVTGLDGLGYHALNELLLAADCRKPA